MSAGAFIDPSIEQDGMIADKVQKAEKRLAQYPYDTEAWSVLIREIQGKKIEDARPMYERLIGQFINSGRYWKLYIEHEMKSKNYDKVEKLFQRCLIKVLNIELWKLYLTYIKETKFNLPTYREKMAQAYDFALDKIGMDLMSYQIWADYIAFLKSVDAMGSYAENQKISAVRKVYQRGVVNPMINIEFLWKDYCNFEQTINPMIAKKMQDDRGRDYMNARRVAKEYEIVTKGINRNNPSVPPQNTSDELKQIDLWRKYIAWEKSNPLRTEEQSVIIRRVMFAYEQCILCLDQHPDIWIEAATYLDQMSKQLSEKGVQVDNSGKTLADEAAAVFERATTTTMKCSMLVYFAYADFEEGRLKYEKVHSIYKRLLEIPDIDPTLVYVQYMRFARRVEGVKAARLVFKSAREDSRSKYHIYIHAALMEFYCSKDQTIAFKIFDLAFKKFGSEVEFLKEFINYLSHINEDNNTRVLFERILTSGQLPPNKALDIWNKFLEFEVNIGDLSSIVKVEKRRLQGYAAEQQDIRETSLLVDRYKYLDLYPCQPTELTAIGYKLPATAKSSGTASATAAAAAVTTQPVNGCSSADGSSELSIEVSKHRPKYPRPDYNTMLPFKPKRHIPMDAYPVPGGVFPVPPAAADLLSRMPPPYCFNGPFVIIDKLLEQISSVQLTEDILRQYDNNGSVDIKASDKGTLMSIDLALGRKRKSEQRGGGGPDSDDETVVAPPTHDIYRQRQQKKIK